MLHEQVCPLRRAVLRHSSTPNDLSHSIEAGIARAPNTLVTDCTAWRG
jgi:hypothetical protein